jgi:hypothetical protein
MYDPSNILHLYCIFTVHLTLLRLVILCQFQLYSVFINTSRSAIGSALDLFMESVHSVPGSS